MQYYNTDFHFANHSAIGNSCRYPVLFAYIACTHYMPHYKLQSTPDNY